MLEDPKDAHVTGGGSRGAGTQGEAMQGNLEAIHKPVWLPPFPPVSRHLEDLGL